MTTQVLYRKANVSSQEAKDALLARFPKAKLVSLETKVASADEARAARTRVGDLVYEATLKLAEFPPGGGDEGGEDKEEAPEPKDEGPPADDGGDDDGGGDAPEFGSKDEGGDEGLGEKPKKMKPEEEMVHLLHQILDALKGGAGGLPGGPGDDLGAPDLGGPPPGGPGAGGPPSIGGPPTKAPLPPPVKPKAPMGGPAFSSVKTATAFRVEANTLGNKALLAECAEIYPTHEVTKIQRKGQAELEGKIYDLEKNNIAVVTLERR